MTLVSFAFMLGSIRVNVLFVLVFFGLVMLFAFIAAADLYVASAGAALDPAHLDKLLAIAGGFGMIGAVCGWYVLFRAVL